MLLVACGLKHEARIVARAFPEAVIVTGGGDAERLEAALDRHAAHAPSTMLSIGIAGALDPALPVGTVIVAGDAHLIGELTHILPDARAVAIVGRDRIAATASCKQALRRASGADAVDTESHVTERVARRHGVLFGVLRAISDAATDDLPPAARVGMAPDGSVALAAVLTSLLRQPGQLPALLRTARSAHRAASALERALGTLARARSA